LKATDTGRVIGKYLIDRTPFLKDEKLTVFLKKLKMVQRS